MKPQGLRPARVDFSGPVPRALDYGDVYHPRVGPQAQLQHVFLDGNGLPERWRGRERFAILETGFGLGHNFLGTWAAWRRDPQRCDWLEFVSIELHPATIGDLERAHDRDSGADIAPLARQLIQAWPPMTPGLHRIRLDEARVWLTLCFGDARQLLPALVGRFDAFFLDGFDPARNPALWEPRLLRSLARLAADGACAATWSVAALVRRSLGAAGFTVRRQPGLGQKREVLQARFAPRFQPRLPVGRPAAAPPARRQAVVVGAGLAGAAVAAGLAQRGWRCTVLEAASAPARAASGNPAGLFHGALHADESLHARLHRAGALHAARHYAPLIASGAVPGAVNGVLARRPQAGSGWPDAPEDYVCPLSADQTRAVAGCDLPGPALLYRQGGWISPVDLVRHWLAQPGVSLQTGAEVAAVTRAQDGSSDWIVGDAQGHRLAQAPVVVLACGVHLPVLAAPLGLALSGARVTRGQLQWMTDAPALGLPVTGHGYAVRLNDGRLVFGAASRPDDPDTGVSAEDTAWNLKRLHALTGIEAPREWGADGLPAGRVSHRLGTRDRLPLIGPVPDLQALIGAGPQDQVRRVPRQRGLLVVGALGSRGLTWAPLAADILLGWLEGATMPLEADLLDAVDPAREWVRQNRG